MKHVQSHTSDPHVAGHSAGSVREIQRFLKPYVAPEQTGIVARSLACIRHYPDIRGTYIKSTVAIGGAECVTQLAASGPPDSVDTFAEVFPRLLDASTPCEDPNDRVSHGEVWPVDTCRMWLRGPDRIHAAYDVALLQSAQHRARMIDFEAQVVRLDEKFDRLVIRLDLLLTDAEDRRRVTALAESLRDWASDDDRWAILLQRPDRRLMIDRACGTPLYQISDFIHTPEISCWDCD
ncbi:MAG: hypothetical protein AAGB51_14060 [Planctomycetota bacterium]